MSTINAQNYGDGTGSVPASAVLEGTAKAWAKSSGTPAILDSYNISSVDDNGTGNFDLNLTNAMSDDDFSCPANQNGNNADLVSSAAISTSEVNFAIWNTAEERRDRGLNALMLGDLA